MVKIKRADRLQNEDRIASYFIKYPKATVREAAQELGISRQTVSTHRKNLDKIGQKDDTIISLTNDDLAIVRKAQKLIMDKLSDDKQTKKMNIREISQVAKDSTGRYTMFRGDVTNNEGGLKDMRSMSDDELYQIIGGKE